MFALTKCWFESLFLFENENRSRTIFFDFGEQKQNKTKKYSQSFSDYIANYSLPTVRSYFPDFFWSLSSAVIGMTVADTVDMSRNS